MAENVNANIDFTINTTQAVAAMKQLQSQISAFHTSMARGAAQTNAASRQMQQNLIDSINATGKFEARLASIQSTTEAFTTALEKNKFSLGEYFRYAGAASKNFGKMFTKEFDVIEKVATERVKDLQTQFIAMGRDANGVMQSIKIRPLTLDMTDLGTQTQVAAQKAALLNKLIDQGSTNMLNWGKNTQWAGRQLMVGFTVPLTMLGSVASKTFMDIEEQIIKLRRVYGDFSTTVQDTDKMVSSIRQLATEFTKYGVAVQDTMQLAADAAATGKMGAELIDQVTEATRLAVLGNVKQADALQTTMSITNAFGTATEQLAGKIDFLNAVENQSVTSIEDLTEAIPKAGPVIKQLGGDVEDLAFFLTAMREGGINAAEGANALKSGLASLINPSAKASQFLQGFGISINGIVEANKGDIKGLVTDFAGALDKLDPLNRARAIEQLFGKFQFSRLSTLFQNVNKEGSQAQRVLDLTRSSAEELAIVSQRELSRVSESTTYRFKKSVADFQSALAPVGEEFLKAITPFINMASDILKSFNQMSGGAKQFATNLTLFIGGVGPAVLMTVGLIANGVANLIKFFNNMRNVFSDTGSESENLGESTKYMTQEQIQAAAVASSLDQAHNTLIQTFGVEGRALDLLVSKYQDAIGIQEQYRRKTGNVGPSNPNPPGFANGVVSVPGPKGAGDIIPAMLSPGEAVIPAKMTSRYRPLIQGMISGNLPGYADGGILGQGRVDTSLFNTDYGTTPGGFQQVDGVMHYLKKPRNKAEGTAELVAAELYRRLGGTGVAMKSFPGGVIGSEELPGVIDTYETTLEAWIRSQADPIAASETLLQALKHYAENDAPINSLLGNIDTHPGNIMFDPISKKLVNMDVGNSILTGFDTWDSEFSELATDEAIAVKERILAAIKGAGGRDNRENLTALAEKYGFGNLAGLGTDEPSNKVNAKGKISLLQKLMGFGSSFTDTDPASNRFIQQLIAENPGLESRLSFGKLSTTSGGTMADSIRELFFRAKDAKDNPIYGFEDGGIVGNSVVAAFGAHQPFTVAHEMIARLGQQMAAEQGSVFKQFSTMQGKSKRSLLEDELKKKLIEESIGVTPELTSNPFSLMESLSEQGIKNLTLLLGEDRMSSTVFDLAAEKFGITLQKVGIPRDPSSPSGTQTRLAISNNDIETYKQLIASGATDETKTIVFDQMRKAMGLEDGGILGQPIKLRSRESIEREEAVAEGAYQAYLASSLAGQEPEPYVKQHAPSTGFSFPIPGVGGMYMTADGRAVFVKPVLDEQAARAEMMGTEIARSGHNLKSPQQRMVVLEDPTDITGRRRFLGLESPYDPTFTPPEQQSFTKEQFFKQLVASLVRNDKDLQAGNLFGDVLADVGPAGVFARASRERTITSDLPSMEEQAMVNLLGVKGGAKKDFAENTLGIANSMTAEEYSAGIQAEIQRVLPQVKNTIAGFDLNPEEQAAYAAMIARLEAGQNVDWSMFHGVHTAVKPRPLKLADGGILDDNYKIGAGKNASQQELEDAIFKAAQYVYADSPKFAPEGSRDGLTFFRNLADDIAMDKADVYRRQEIADIEKVIASGGIQSKFTTGQAGRGGFEHLDSARLAVSEMIYGQATEGISGSEIYGYLKSPTLPFDISEILPIIQRVAATMGKDPAVLENEIMGQLLQSNDGILKSPRVGGYGELDLKFNRAAMMASNAQAILGDSLSSSTDDLLDHSARMKAIRAMPLANLLSGNYTDEERAAMFGPSNVPAFYEVAIPGSAATLGNIDSAQLLDSVSTIRPGKGFTYSQVSAERVNQVKEMLAKVGINLDTGMYNEEAIQALLSQYGTFQPSTIGMGIKGYNDTKTFENQGVTPASLTDINGKPITIDDILSKYERVAKGGTGWDKDSRSWRRIPGYANGVVSVPGPKGAGDIMPAMLSPGEAVIPAKHAQKYSGLIRGMVSGNIPGFMAGTIDAGGERSGGRRRRTVTGVYEDVASMGIGGDIQTVMGGASNPKIEAMVARMLTEVFPDLSSEDYQVAIEDLTRVVRQMEEVGTKDVIVLKNLFRYGADLVSFFEQTGQKKPSTEWLRANANPAAIARTQQSVPNFMGDTKTEFAHMAEGVTMSSKDFVENFGHILDQLPQALQNAIRESALNDGTVDLLGGLAMDIKGRTNKQLAQDKGATVAQFEEDFNAAGIGKWSRSIEIGGGNVEMLTGAAQRLDDMFKSIVEQSGATRIVDSQQQVAEAQVQTGEQVIAAQEVMKESILRLSQSADEADRALAATLVNAQATLTEVRPDGFSAGTRREFGGYQITEADTLLAEDAGRKFGNDIFTAIINGLNDAFKISSPSRVAREVGENVSDGFVQGGESGIPDATAAGQDIANAIVTAVAPDIIDAAYQDNAIIDDLVSKGMDKSEAVQGVIEARNKIPVGDGLTPEEQKQANRARSYKIARTTGLIASGLSMAGSFLPGDLGKAAQSAVGPITAATTAMQMIPGPWGIAAGAIALVGSVFIEVNKALDETRAKASALTQALGTGAKAMESFATFAGKATSSEIMATRRAAAQTGYAIQPGKNKFGISFMASEEGQAMLTNVQQGLEQIGRSATIKKLGDQLTMAVVSGALSEKQAQSISYALGKELKDFGFTIGISARIKDVVGTDGKKIEGNELTIASKLTGTAITDLNKIFTTIGEINKNGTALFQGFDIAKLEGQAAGGIMDLVSGQQQIVDTLELEYSNRIKNLEAENKFGEASRLSVELEEKKSELLAQNRQNLEAILGLNFEQLTRTQTATTTATTVANNMASISTPDLGTQSRENIGAIEGEVIMRARTVFAGTEDEQRANTIIDKIRSNTPSELGIILTANLAAGNMSVDNLEIFTKLFDGNTNAYNILANVSASLGGPAADQMVRLLDFFPPGVDAPQKRIDFMTNISLMDPVKSQKALDALTTLSNYAGVGGLNVQAIIEFFTKNERSLDIFIARMEKVNNLKKRGKLDVKSVLQQDILISGSEEAFKDNADYFNKLDPVNRVLYIQTFLTEYQTIGTQDIQAYRAANESVTAGKTDAQVKGIMATETSEAVTKTAEALNKVTNNAKNAGDALSNAFGGTVFDRLTALIDVLNKKLAIIQRKEDKINKKYDERKKTLDEIAKINDQIVKQQSGQLDLADALAKGDVAAAARAIQKYRADASAYAIQQQQDVLEKQRETELNAVSFGGETRESIEKKLARLEMRLAKRDYRDALEYLRTEGASANTGGANDSSPDRPKGPRGPKGPKYTSSERKEEKVTPPKSKYANWVYFNGRYYDPTKYAFSRGANGEVVQIIPKVGIDQLKTGSVSKEGRNEEIKATNRAAIDLNQTFKNLEDGGKATASALESVTPKFKDRIDQLAEEAVQAGKTKLTTEELTNKIQDMGYKVKDGKVSIDVNGKKIEIALKDVGSIFATTSRKLAKHAKAGEDLANGDITLRAYERIVEGMANGGLVKGFAMGGIIPKYFANGDLAIGTDTIPAMLTPGEFVVTRDAVQEFGVNNLRAINSGKSLGDSVYNYSVTVNAATTSNADEIARTVMQKMKQVENTRLRGNRY